MSSSAKRLSCLSAIAMAFAAVLVSLVGCAEKIGYDERILRETPDMTLEQTIQGMENLPTLSESLGQGDYFAWYVKSPEGAEEMTKRFPGVDSSQWPQLAKERHMAELGRLKAERKRRGGSDD